MIIFINFVIHIPFNRNQLQSENNHNVKISVQKQYYKYPVIQIT